MPGAIDVAGAKIAEQELISAEDIERQKAVVVIVTMKEAFLLVAMNRIIGGIKVEDQFIGRRIKRLDELLDHHLMDRHCALSGDRILHPTVCRITGQPSLMMDGRLNCTITA